MLCDNFLWQPSPPSAPDSLLRKLAGEIYRTASLPDSSDEEWVFTSLNQLAKQTLPPSPQPSPQFDSALKEIVQKGEGGEGRVVFVNGYFSKELSVTPEHVKIGALESDDGESYGDYFARLPLAAMSVQCSHDILQISIAAKAKACLQIIFIGDNDGALSHHGHCLHLSVGEGAEVELYEKHASARAGAAYVHHDFLRLQLAAEARVNHYKLQLTDKAAVHLGHADVHVQGGADYNYRLLHLGGALARQDLHVHLLQASAAADVRGLLLPVGEQVNHLSTDLRHIAGDCNSNQQIKIIAAGGGQATYQGQVHIADGADGSVGHQQSRGLLLDGKSTINTKPQLEIFADAVECAHGSAVGELQEEAVFYLKSRGIDDAHAYDLLLQAYVGEIAETFAPCHAYGEIDEGLRQRMQQFATHLKARRQA